MIALEMLRRWNSPRTAKNIAAVEELLRIPASLAKHAEEHAPRSWICSGTMPRPFIVPRDLGEPGTMPARIALA